MLEKSLKFSRSILLFFCMLLNIFFSNIVICFPKEIIIIRHADKLEQKEPGPTLSPRGFLRSVAFGLYYLKNFDKPDFIFATNPVSEQGKNSSIRELQTIAPLANMLAAGSPDTGFAIMHPYASDDYATLAADLLQNPQYTQKRVLICWNHIVIPALAEKLGVKTRLEKWPVTDFDSVYILSYDKSEGLKNFKILSKQYPVNFTSAWPEIDAAHKH